MTSTEELGPNINEAKAQLNGPFKQEFLEVVDLQSVDPKYHEKVKTMINESINEGVDEVYKQLYSDYQPRTEFEDYRPYSKQGGAMFVLSKCEDAAKRIYLKKLKEAAPEMVAAAEREEREAAADAEREEREAAADKLKIRGGRRKKHRKIKGKYTFKKRKSIRKKKKRRTRKL